MGGTDGSPGSTTGRHHRDEERSWLEMLAADDDVEDPSLLRAPDLTTRGGESPDAPVLDDDRLRSLPRPLGDSLPPCDSSIFGMELPSGMQVMPPPTRTRAH